MIAAALGLLVSLFFALRRRRRLGGADHDRQTTTAVQTTTEAPPATTEQVTTEAPPTTTAGAGDRGASITSSSAASRRAGSPRDSVAHGRDVVITVTSDVADEVHVHGYDLMADVAPGAPATIRFTADAPGRFEIELENTGVQIAELEVRP